MPLILNESDVRAVLPLSDLIPVMERTLVRSSTGGVVQPLRSVLNVGPDEAYYGVMPAFLDDPEALGAKLVTIYERNATRGLPSHLATIVLLDPQTGALSAVLDGRYITEARTAAVSAVAARHLTRPGGPVAMAILGSGVQARSHLRAFTQSLAVSEVRIWSPTGAHRERFVAEMAPTTDVLISTVTGPEAAVRDAGLIVLATAASQPVIRVDWVSDGAHVTSVGAPVPHQREMDPALVARARVFVDSHAGALAESGDLVMGINEGHFNADHVLGEIGEVISGRLPGRTSDADVTIFKSLGMAVEDVAAAHLAYGRARERGRGTAVEW